MAALTIARSDHPGCTVVAVTGEIDLASEPVLRAELERVPGTDLVLDLSEVGFLGAVALHVLVDARDRLRASHHRFVLVESPAVERLTALTGLRRSLLSVRARDQAPALVPSQRSGEHPHATDAPAGHR
jgi:anti-anti-sigma factor